LNKTTQDYIDPANTNRVELMQMFRAKRFAIGAGYHIVQFTFERDGNAVILAVQRDNGEEKWATAVITPESYADNQWLSGHYHENFRGDCDGRIEAQVRAENEYAQRAGIAETRQELREAMDPGVLRAYDLGIITWAQAKKFLLAVVKPEALR